MNGVFEATYDFANEFNSPEMELSTQRNKIVFKKLRSIFPLKQLIFFKSFEEPDRNVKVDYLIGDLQINLASLVQIRNLNDRNTWKTVTFRYDSKLTGNKLEWDNIKAEYMVCSYFNSNDEITMICILRIRALKLLCDKNILDIGGLHPPKEPNHYVNVPIRPNLGDNDSTLLSFDVVEMKEKLTDDEWNSVIVYEEGFIKKQKKFQPLF